MWHRAAIPAILCALFALPTLAGEEEDPVAFLKEVRKKYHDLSREGLTSFSARITLQMTNDPNMAKAKELATFDYAWTAPATQDFQWDPKCPAKLRQGLQRTVGYLWQDLTGILLFHSIEKAAGLKMEAGESETVLTGKITSGDARAVFVNETSLLKEFTLPKIQIKVVYRFAKEKDLFRLESKDILQNESVTRKTTYSARRKINNLIFPTVFLVEAKEKQYRFGVEFLTINQKPAKAEELDVKEIKEKVKAFEKGWRKWSDEEKIEQMKALSALDHDFVSASIAKLGLRDRSAVVKEGTAKVLGLMKRKNVTPMVISVLKASEKQIKVYLHMIWALGELNDPRAVDILSKDWWNQRIGEYGAAAAKQKIEALGKIRHVASVDALIDVFYMTRDNTISQFKEPIRNSLKKLTGQDFIYDRKAWKGWWKQNRAVHRFESGTTR